MQSEEYLLAWTACSQFYTYFQSAQKHSHSPCFLYKNKNQLLFTLSFQKKIRCVSMQRKHIHLGLASRLRASSPCTCVTYRHRREMENILDPQWSLQVDAGVGRKVLAAVLVRQQWHWEGEGEMGKYRDLNSPAFEGDHWWREYGKRDLSVIIRDF